MKHPKTQKQLKYVTSYKYLISYFKSSLFLIIGDRKKIFRKINS